MYDDSEACVRINGIKSDWFNINSGVRDVLCLIGYSICIWMGL